MEPRLTRRDFLVYGGATVAGVTLGEFGRRQLARADARAAGWPAPRHERWAASVCRACPAGCGIRARLIDDVPVKIEGSPLCPLSRGRLCAKGHAALEAYFDPDRLTGPARRADRSPGSRWEPIGWDAAFALVASEVRAARERPGGLVAVAAEEHGPLADAWSGFWRAAGARVAWVYGATAARLRRPFRAVTGVDADPLFDLEHATHVLSFGAPLVEDWLSPVWAQRAYGRFRRGTPQSRGRLVQIDMRRSMTARKADEWIAVAVDRQAALAYGIAAVLLREGRMRLREAGPPDGALADFERLVVARYLTNEVAAATGVPVVTILRLARELVATPRPLVVVAADAEPALADAVFSLNALIGAFDRDGGVFAASPTPRPEEVDAAGLLEEAPAPSLVALADPSLFRSPALPAGIADQVAAATFVVSFSPYLDETARHADVLLPLHTPLESWQAVVPPAAARGEAIALARPAAPARLDTRDAGAALRALAMATDERTAAACPWETSADIVQGHVERLSRERRGTPYTTLFQTEWIDRLQHGGWWTPSAASPPAFAAAVLDAGGWLDPFFEPGEIQRGLDRRGGPALVVPVAGVLPADQPPATSAGAYTLRAVGFIPAVVDRTGGQNQPSLFEVLGQPDGPPWQPWAELNPETAHAAGIHAGERVRISSAHGTVDVAAVLVERARPDLVAVACLPTLPDGGRWARAVVADGRALWPPDRAVTGPVAVGIRRL